MANATARAASDPHDSIDVIAALADAPIGALHRRLALLVGLTVMFEGYDTFNASYVIHYVMGPWGLRPGQAGLLVSSGMVGFACASAVQGKVADAFGRRVAIVGALWIATVFSLATALWADSFWTFCLWRFLTGMGLGVLLPVSVAYLNEFAPARARTLFGTWSWAAGFSLGGVIASAVGVFLTPTFGWQSLYYVASLSAFVAIACHAWLPESPKFLALRHRDGDLAKLLAALDPRRAAAYLRPDARFVLREPESHVASLGLLLTHEYRALTLASWGAAFCVLFAIYGLTTWAPNSMLARGE